MSNYNLNDIVEGTVTGVETYGIFVSLDDNYNGLIHISEISNNFVRNVKDYANIGDKIKAKIIEIDEDNHQIKLSIKEFESLSKKSKREKIIEKGEGFSPLENHLEQWINEKMEEIDKKK